ncbi:MAG: right-handed parallel beta-helix repeat-containing protein [Kiritimatiellae bacterium]|nr:right-handed parallel beta-helix repeat-containing protein [Kiritimatiellia bacterium]
MKLWPVPMLSLGILLHVLATRGDEMPAPRIRFVDGPGGDGLAEGGDDSNPGTLDAPWRTIVHGASQLKPGDTLYIRGGIYREYPDDVIPSGTPAARVVVANHEQETVTIRNPPGETKGYVLTIAGSYITIKGLVLDGERKAGKPLWIGAKKGGATPLHVRVENVTAMNGRSSGILTGCSYSAFIDVHSHHNGRDRRDHGIYMGEAVNNVIDGGEFSHNTGYGLHIYTAKGAPLLNNVIRNCVSHHNKVAGAIIATGEGNVAYNNVVFANPCGINVRGRHTRLFNNTIYGNRQALAIHGTKNVEIRNNILYKSSWVAQGSRGTPRANTDFVMADNFTGADPMFVDPEAGDFRLREGSPAAGAGAVLVKGEAGRVRPMAPAAWAARPEFQVAPVAPETLAAAQAEVRARLAAEREAARKAAAEAAANRPPPVTYFVAPGGDDAGPGTEEQPWRTLQKASRSVSPGDIVRIRAGEYTGTRPGQSAWRVDKAGAADAPITYKAYGDGEVRIHNATIIPAASWTPVKDAIYATALDPKARIMGLFQNHSPVHAAGKRLQIASVAEMLPNSYFKTNNTLYVWLEDGSDPKNSVMRTSSSHVIQLSRCHYTVFDGLTVEFGFVGIKEQNQAHHVTIRNCVLRSLASQGVQPVGADCLIENNLFQDIGTDKFKHAIYASRSGLIVRHNVFERIAGAAVHLYGGAPQRGARICGNVFRNVRPCTTRSERKYYTDLILWAGSGHRVCNNVFYGEGKRAAISLKSGCRILHNTFAGCPTAISFYKGETGNRILNNIFLDSAETFLRWPAESREQILDYNLYFAGTGTPNWECDGTRYPTFDAYRQAAGETHSRYADPGLAGPADARLRAGSPAIDAASAPASEAGSATDPVAVDAKGTARPQGRAADIGAYEFKDSGAGSAAALPK